VSSNASPDGRRSRPWLRVVVEVVVVAALLALGWVEHTTVTQSIKVLGHVHWEWVLAACGFELLSMMAFARTQRIVLRATGVHASIRAMAATALAGNAISVSLPLVGPGAGSVFTYGRFRQVADDPAPAGWTLLISGLISNVVWVFLVALGATVSGNPATTIGGVLAGAGLVVATILGVVALHHARSRRSIIHQGARLVRISQRLSDRPVGDPEDLTQHAVDAVSAFRMRRSEWAQTIGLSCINWLTSVGCFVAAILAVGAGVPWTKVLLIYCAGATASSFNLTPGGLGVTEAVLAAGLVAARMRPAEALGSVLVFRLISFWLVTLVGWLIYSALRRKKSHHALES
jgi:uncharacterized membrane protein YbhN (UPF0104 family)